MHVQQEDSDAESELDGERDLIEQDVPSHVLDECQPAPGLDKVAA